MLPGLRFLCASVILAVAIVTFALGAAALLRATHENFVSLPAWKSPSDTMVALALPQDGRQDMPMLAILRVEPSEIERDAIPSIPAKIGPVESAVALAPPPAVTAPRIVVAALPSRAEDAPPVVALPPLAPLAAMPRQMLRTGPLLMPEIATNDAPPVNFASLDPAMFERDAEPLEFAPLPRRRPGVVTLRMSSRLAQRRRLLQRRFASVQPAPAPVPAIPLVIPPIFNRHAP
jgi:hypothetical protein